MPSWNRLFMYNQFYLLPLMNTSKNRKFDLLDVPPTIFFVEDHKCELCFKFSCIVISG